MIELGPNAYIYRLSTGELVNQRKSGTKKKKWRCGDYVELFTNILDGNMGEQAQGGGQLWKLEGKKWKQIAIAEGEYQLNDLRSARVPQSVLDCLDIEGFQIRISAFV